MTSRFELFGNASAPNSSHTFIRPTNMSRLRVAIASDELEVCWRLSLKVPLPTRRLRNFGMSARTPARSPCAVLLWFCLVLTCHLSWDKTDARRRTDHQLSDLA
jgi:hypothetical protein